MRINIPVGVARTVLASTFVAMDVKPEHQPVLNRFQKTASNTKYRTGIDVFTAEDCAAVAAVIDPVIDENRTAGAKVLGPLVAFSNEIIEVRARFAERESVEAEEQKQHDADSREKSKRFRAERQEQPMALMVESGRAEALAVIAERYGLDPKRKQIQAALIAAFHEGIIRYRQSSESLMYVEPQAADSDVKKKWQERDARLFAAAREQARVIAEREQDQV